MRTVGEILRKAREEKNLSLEDVEKQLRIRKKFLTSLEENKWNQLPSLPYIKGFLRNYSTFLGLMPEEMIAVFRRQFRDKEKGGILPDVMTNPVSRSTLRFSPQSILFGFATFLIVTFFGYLSLQYRAYTSAPSLEITRPQEGQTYTEESVTISGHTDPDAVISVNKQDVALQPNGEFTTSLKLTPGINTVIIESTSKSGKKTSVTRTVQLQEKQ